MQVDLENYNIKEITTEVSNTFLKGEKGDIGLQGPQGIQGEQGEQGPQGEIGPAGPVGNGIEDIGIELSAGINSVYIIKLTDGRTKEFVVRNGRGIEKIEKVDTTELVDTYQITFNDTTTTTFQVKNGEKGDKGEKGDTGSQGPQGVQGLQGIQGEQGIQGQKGDAFTYDDFTPEQLEALRGPQGIQGPQGVQGTKGDTGAPGPQGIQGEIGPANTISIGTVTKGNEAKATITGNAPNQTLNLVLPKGDKGEAGEGRGIEKVEETSYNTETGEHILTIYFTDETTYNFSVYDGPQGIQGLKGDTGAQGIQGLQGPVGPTNTLSIGTVSSGTEAKATITGNAPNQTLNLVLPKGESGASETVLYEGTTTTDFTLNDKISNYKYIDIYYYCSYGYYCQTMLSPGMYVMDIYINCTKIYPNGGNVSAGIIEDKFFATMEVSGGDQVTVKTNGRTSSGSYTASNDIVIKKVVGRN